MTGLEGELYSYGYDAAGRLTSLTCPAATGLTERFAYDADGRQVRHRLGTAASPGSLYNDTLHYSARGKVLRVQMRAIAREAEHGYSGLGHVVAARWQSTNSSDYQIDEFRLDAHGNTYWSQAGRTPERLRLRARRDLHGAPTLLPASARDRPASDARLPAPRPRHPPAQHTPPTTPLPPPHPRCYVTPHGSRPRRQGRAR